MNNKEEYKIQLELLNHPGEILKEEITERKMKQAELAKRCGLSEKHISSIISGKKAISVSFAKKLEYVLGIDSGFWLNLQMNYDVEFYDIKEKAEIKEEEFNILNNSYFKKIINWIEDQKLIEKTENKISQIINLREFLNVSNLININNINLEGAFRLQDKIKVDSHTLATWIKVCELYTKDIETQNSLDIDKLIRNIELIKSYMFIKNPNQMIEKIKQKLLECGVVFNVIPHFTGAPVHGYIKKYDDKVMLCSTIRGKYSDKFWFTLFHEIAHIINKDFKESLLDFEEIETKKEKRADIYAKNTLLTQKNYNKFINQYNINRETIIRFSADNNVLTCITVGRLQKDGYIKYDQYNDLRYKYEWKN